MEIPDLDINFVDLDLWIAVGCILFNPFYWNVMARCEYRTHLLSRICCSSRKFACFLLAISILCLGVYRDYRFYIAIGNQPRWLILQQNSVLWSGHFLVMFGSVLVLSSFWALGFFGTFLGDYFGMLLPSKVTSFPFNFMNNPMYWGSTANFLGISLVNSSQAGLFLTLIVAATYRFALYYEESFTNIIYAEAAESKLRRTRADQDITKVKKE